MYGDGEMTRSPAVAVLGMGVALLVGVVLVIVVVLLVGHGVR